VKATVYSARKDVLEYTVKLLEQNEILYTKFKTGVRFKTSLEKYNVVSDKLGNKFPNQRY
jgi:hypothetical protein